MGTKLKWLVEIEVDARIVGDGFDLTDVRALRMLMGHLPYAFGSELGARVLEAPKESEIRELQGADVAELAKLRALEKAVETGDCGCRDHIECSAHVERTAEEAARWRAADHEDSDEDFSPEALAEERARSL